MAGDWDRFFFFSCFSLRCARNKVWSWSCHSALKCVSNRKTRKRQLPSHHSLPRLNPCWLSQSPMTYRNSYRNRNLCWHKKVFWHLCVGVIGTWAFTGVLWKCFYYDNAGKSALKCHSFTNSWTFWMSLAIGLTQSTTAHTFHWANLAQRNLPWGLIRKENKFKAFPTSSWHLKPFFFFPWSVCEVLRRIRYIFFRKC